MLIDLKLFDESELTKIHDYTLKVLQDPGMKIQEQRMLLALKKKGAEVCLDSNIVRFPNSIINETIDLLRKDIEEGKSPKYLNGVTCEKTGSLKM
jgi:trimethylamine:corrinoid methyltransferase-like protein